MDDVADIGRAAQASDHRVELIRMEIIVRIQDAENLAPCLSIRRSQRRRLAGIGGLTQQLDARILPRV